MHLYCIASGILHQLESVVTFLQHYTTLFTTKNIHVLAIHLHDKGVLLGIKMQTFENGTVFFVLWHLL